MCAGRRMPKSDKKLAALLLSNQMAGQKTPVNHSKGRATQRLICSGCKSASDFGANSPSTICKKVIPANASVPATVCRAKNAKGAGNPAKT